jgi:hypothetical protein
MKKKAEQMAADGHTKRRILLRSMRYSLRAQSAPLVRGSSRRIMTLRFRPAYIRVINRRYLSTAATCFAFPNKTGWIFLCRGRSSPEEPPIQNLSNQEFYPWLDKSLHIRTKGCVSRRRPSERAARNPTRAGRFQYRSERRAGRTLCRWIRRRGSSPRSCLSGLP